MRTVRGNFRRWLCLLALISATPNARAELVTRLETFDVDPGWSSAGSGLNGNNFGYQSSSFAGGNAGEGGGRFTRSDFMRFYGDTDLGGLLTLDDEFSASGLFDFTERNTPDFVQPLVLGHFDSNAVIRENKIGLLFLNSNSVNELSWGIGIRFSDGSKLDSSSFILSPNVDREWSYAWNPTGGAFGSGQLIGSLSGPGGGSIALDVTPELRALGATFDGFGLNGGFPTPSNPISGDYADFYIDNVSYSTALAVPEPSTLTMFLVGLAVLSVRRRWRLPGKKEESI